MRSPLMLVPALLAAALTTAAPLSPQQTLGRIRSVFRSHRPPPPFVTYTLDRKQNASNGYPDLAESYTEHIWCRTSDRAALARRVYRDDARGDLTFARPAFNEDRDPGPPTADVFEPAPVHPHPIEFVPTPEPLVSAPPLIGGTAITVDFDYRVSSMTAEGDDVHLRLEPKRDPDRNRIREIWADRATYELHRLVATDKLFVNSGRRQDVYPATDTITLGVVAGHRVVTRVHADVGGGYHDDGQQIDITFTDIAFPSSLPNWYFNARTYAQHRTDAPS